MLESIFIENFKSYKKQTLYLAPLTLLIGANASGKSNAIEAFRFLSWLSQGQKLSTLKQAINESEKLIRGNIQELFYLDETVFSLGSVINQKEWNTLNISITIRDNELHICQEKITDSNQLISLYEIKQASSGYSNDVQVAYNNFKRGKNKPLITCTDQITIINQLVSPALFAKQDEEPKKIIPKVTKIFTEILEDILFLDPIPTKMRTDSYPDKKLKTDGSNLAGVLYTLLEDESNRINLLEFIQSLPEQDIKNIQCTKDKRGQVYFELEENFGKDKKLWSAELLSDGTLRVLAIAAALLSVKKGTTVVIEEIDNGIHPSRAKQLMQTLTKYAEERNLRLLLSTHNPALMDALPDSALGDVVFCYRDELEGDSRLVRLADLPNYPELLVQGTLGELVTQGILDRFVKNPVSVEEKKQKALDWLKSLQGDNNE